MTFRSPRTFALVAGLVLAGCTAGNTGDPQAGANATTSSALWGTAWRLEDLGGVPAVTGVEATLEFPEAGKVSGKGSCNRFFGSVEISGESMKFGPLAATKMACLDAAANRQEVKYLDALQKAERFTRDGPALLIHSTALERPLRFVPASPA